MVYLPHITLSGGRRDREREEGREGRGREGRREGRREVGKGGREGGIKSTHLYRIIYFIYLYTS